MKRTALTLLATLMLAAASPAAMAQVTTSETIGPNGVSTSRTVHRGNVTVTRSASRGRFGLHGCNTVTRTRRTAFGVQRSSVRRCH